MLSCSHRSGVERVPSWSWPTSGAAGSDVCPTFASRNTTMLPSSPRQGFSARALLASILPFFSDEISICRFSSRSGTSSAVWTCSRDVSTTWSTCSVTRQQARTATARRCGTWASTQTSGSGRCVEEVSRSQISELHSSVSGRNYLEHVAETISDWTREEELKREAAKAQRIGPAAHPQGAQSSTCRSAL